MSDFKMIHESEIINLLSELFEYCMETGNQETWDIIFPYLKDYTLKIIPEYIQKKKMEIL